MLASFSMHRGGDPQSKGNQQRGQQNKSDKQQKKVQKQTDRSQKGYVPPEFFGPIDSTDGIIVKYPKTFQIPIGFPVDPMFDYILTDQYGEIEKLLKRKYKLDTKLFEGAYIPYRLALYHDHELTMKDFQKYLVEFFKNKGNPEKQLSKKIKDIDLDEFRKIVRKSIDQALENENGETFDDTPMIKANAIIDLTPVQIFNSLKENLAKKIRNQKGGEGASGVQTWTMSRAISPGYKKGSLVKYTGDIWEYISNDKGDVATPGTSDTVWKLQTPVSEDSFSAVSPPPMPSAAPDVTSTYPKWSPTATYKKGDQVSTMGSDYEYISDTPGNDRVNVYSTVDPKTRERIPPLWKKVGSLSPLLTTSSAPAPAPAARRTPKETPPPEESKELSSSKLADFLEEYDGTDVLDDKLCNADDDYKLLTEVSISPKKEPTEALPEQEAPDEQEKSRYKQIQEKLKAFATKLSGVPEKAKDRILNTLNRIDEGAVFLSSSLKDTINNKLSQINSYREIRVINEKLTELSAFIQGKMVETKEDIRDRIESIKTEVSDWIRDQSEVTKRNIIADIARIRDETSTFSSDVRSTVNSKLEELTTLITSPPTDGSVRQKITNLLDSIQDVIRRKTSTTTSVTADEEGTELAPMSGGKHDPNKKYLTFRRLDRPPADLKCWVKILPIAINFLTPLQFAAGYGSSSTVSQLLIYNADFKIVTMNKIPLANLASQRPEERHKNSVVSLIKDISVAYDNAYYDFNLKQMKKDYVEEVKVSEDTRSKLREFKEAVNAVYSKTFQSIKSEKSTGDVLGEIGENAKKQGRQDALDNKSKDKEKSESANKEIKDGYNLGYGIGQAEAAGTADGQAGVTTPRNEFYKDPNTPQELRKAYTEAFEKVQGENVYKGFKDGVTGKEENPPGSEFLSFDPNFSKLLQLDTVDPKESKRYILAHNLGLAEFEKNIQSLIDNAEQDGELDAGNDRKKFTTKGIIKAKPIIGGILDPTNTSFVTTTNGQEETFEVDYSELDNAPKYAKNPNITIDRSKVPNVPTSTTTGPAGGTSVAYGMYIKALYEYGYNKALERKRRRGKGRTRTYKKKTNSKAKTYKKKLARK